MLRFPALSLRRTSVSLLVWSCALATVAGAAPQAPQTPPAAITMAGYPAPGAPAATTLLSAGAEPRMPLRYTVANALKDQFAMNMNMTMQADMGGMALPQMNMPAMKVGADLAVTDVAANGDITYSIAFTGLNVDTSNVDPQLAAMFQGMDADYKAIKGTGTVTSRGVSVSSKLDTASVTNPQLKQMLDSLSNTLQNLSQPLPEEPVGVGAKWEVRSAVNAGGVQSFQKTSYEIVSITGKAVTLKTTTENTAPPQSVSNPAMQGVEMRLQKMNGSGTGNVTLHLDSLVPTSTTDVQNNMQMSLSMNGDQQTMTTTVSVKITVSSGK